MYIVPNGKSSHAVDERDNEIHLKLGTGMYTGCPQKGYPLKLSASSAGLSLNALTP